VTTLFGAIALVFGVTLAAQDHLYYGVPGAPREAFDGLLSRVPIVVAVACVASRWLAMRRGQVVFYAAALTAALMLLYARIVVLRISPSPHIDVFTSAQRAVDYFLAGKNPYPQSYADIYGGTYDYRPGYPYWPGYLYWSTLGVVLFKKAHDVRVSLVGAEGLAAACLFFGLRRLRVAAPPALFLVVAWLAFPVCLFITEQAWIDPLLVLCFAAAAWALAAGRPLLAGIALGYACGTKQYALFGAILALVHVWRAHGWRGALRFGVACSVVTLLLIVPFFASAPAEFYRSSVTVPATMFPRIDALTVPAQLAHGRGPLDPEALKHLFAPYTWLGIAAFAATTAWLARRRGSATVASWLAACAVAYGFMLLFAKQAFCNYYYFLAFFVVAGAGAALAEESPVPTRAPTSTS
jgi:hypothetical protein